MPHLSHHTPPCAKPIHEGFNRRQYERSRVSVDGRLLLPTGAEHSCQVIDISESGIALACPVETDYGDNIIVYLDDLGRFEGPVIRFVANGFAIQTQLISNQRQRLVDRIEWLKQKKSGSERRVFPRRMPALSKLSDTTSMTVDTGTKILCQVLDISVTGAHVQTNNRPRLGTHVTVGRMVGRVVRHTIEGVGIEFVTTG